MIERTNVVLLFFWYTTTPVGAKIDGHKALVNTMKQQMVDKFATLLAHSTPVHQHKVPKERFYGQYKEKTFYGDELVWWHYRPFVASLWGG